MTNEILEILRHHDDIFSVLTRPAPRFAPFDVGEALVYASETFEHHPIIPAVLMAAWNAHNHTIRWGLTTPASDRSNSYSGYSYDHYHRWGWEKPPPFAPYIALSASNIAYYLYAHYSPDKHPAHVIIEIFAYSNAFPPAYAIALGMGLEELGATFDRKEEPGPETNEDEYTAYNDYIAHLYIPFELFAQCASGLESLVLGDRIGSFDPKTNIITPGPLLISAFEELELKQDEIETLLSTDTYYDDIPF